MNHQPKIISLILVTVNEHLIKIELKPQAKNYKIL